MERKEVGIVLGCQGGITYLPFRKVLRKSSEKERPLPAAFSGGSHQFLSGQSGSRAGPGKPLWAAALGLRQPSSAWESPVSLQDGDPQPAVLLLSKAGAGPHAGTCNTPHSPFLPARVPMSCGWGCSSGSQGCSAAHPTLTLQAAPHSTGHGFWPPHCLRLHVIAEGFMS